MSRRSRERSTEGTRMRRMTRTPRASDTRRRLRRSGRKPQTAGGRISDTRYVDGVRIGWSQTCQALNLVCRVRPCGKTLRNTPYLKVTVELPLRRPLDIHIVVPSSMPRHPSRLQPPRGRQPQVHLQMSQISPPRRRPTSIPLPTHRHIDQTPPARHRRL